jgi:hypothetical protein
MKADFRPAVVANCILGIQVNRGQPEYVWADGRIETSCIALDVENQPTRVNNFAGRVV